MSESDALASGSQLQSGRYVIETVLGAGGFGITYRAHDNLLARTVAIKELFPERGGRSGADIVLPPSYSEDVWEHEIGRFLQEAQAIARLSHPAIVAIYDTFRENHTAYNVMQFISGQSLASLLKQRGPLPEAEAVRYSVAAGQGLAWLHQHGLLHRDIKPHNIMLTDEGSIVLIDLGAARAFSPDQTLSHTVIATYGFAPPEQFIPRARRSPASDIYALAVTCYFLITGDFPGSADRHLSPTVLQAIEHATAFSPGDRPQTVTAFLAELITSPQTIIPTDDWPLDDPQSRTDIRDYIDHYDDKPEPASEWQLISTSGPTMQALSIPTSDEGWAVGEGGMTMHYQKGNWTAGEIKEASNLTAIHMLSDDYGWAAGWYGYIFRYLAGKWQRFDTPTSEHYQAIYMTAPDEGWAMGRHGIIARCQRGEWQIVASPLRPFAERNVYGVAPDISTTHDIPDINAIHMTSHNEGWAVGENGTMLRCMAGNWQLHPSPTDKTLQAIQMFPEQDDGWAVGWEGTILRYGLGGWQVLEAPNKAYYFALHMTAPDSGWAVGSTGNIIRCIAGQWQAQISPTDQPLRGVTATDDGTAWIVGYFGHILRREPDRELARH